MVDNWHFQLICQGPPFEAPVVPAALHARLFEAPVVPAALHARLFEAPVVRRSPVWGSRHSTFACGGRESGFILDKPAENAKTLTMECKDRCRLDGAGRPDTVCQVKPR